MNDFPLLALAPGGLVAFLAALVVLAVRRALEGGSGVSFADLGTAVAIGVGTALVQTLATAIALRRFRRSSSGFSTSTHVVMDTQRRAGDRFDRFTDDARRVLTIAQDEAQRLNHNYIGTEHLLLGLLREDAITSRVLTNLRVDPTAVRTAIEFIAGRGGAAVSGEIGLRPDAKRAMELAIDEARALGSGYIGAAHLLLGVVREHEGVAAGVLESLNVTIDRLRPEVIRELQRSEGRGKG